MSVPVSLDGVIMRMNAGAEAGWRGASHGAGDSQTFLESLSSDVTAVPGTSGPWPRRRLEAPGIANDSRQGAQVAPAA